MNPRSAVLWALSLVATCCLILLGMKLSGFSFFGWLEVLLLAAAMLFPALWLIYTLPERDRGERHELR